LTLAVHAIDQQETSVLSNVTVNFVELYEGEDSFSRYHLRNPEDWRDVVMPKLREASKTLEAYRTRRVHVVGSMRLPLWFAVGRELPDVRTWVLSIDQRTEEWVTNAPPEPDIDPMIDEIILDQGAELAVVVGLTINPVDEVRRFLVENKVPIARLVVVGPNGKPGNDAVRSNEWLTAWVRVAREQIRRVAQSIGAQRVHLFMSGPASSALMLGHQWNVMPPTLLYEYDRVSYFPTISVS
jgi:hypothetical protein